ncbi:phage tail protein [Dasania marina]|uniref:phage tail-collar fiber domain-containing protein n=1 Tax=Dasania marina TaxID=471499 RepID=UPI000371C498|nr:phage tail protein [Dasania marina]
MGAIVNTGQAYIAAQAASAQPVVISGFVLAYISGLNPADPVNLNEAMPAAGDIVYEAAVTQQGYINGNSVVYSLLMGSSVGDFDFNWIGLKADDDNLFAVAYAPTIEKRKTTTGLTGNNISRNFAIEFADAQSATNITIEASTWQIDFTGRLNDTNELTRQHSDNIYGNQAFYGDGWQVHYTGGVHKIKAGVGYVGGIRISNASEQTITASPAPTKVWLDVYTDGDLSGITNHADIVINNSTQSNYVDGLGNQHFLVKIAEVASGGAVTDTRAIIDSSNLLAFINKRLTDVDLDIGTRLLFPQATVPTGWVIITTHNNVALKVVNTGGGSVAGTNSFSSVFNTSFESSESGEHNHSATVNNRTLGTSQIPSHWHYSFRNVNSSAGLTSSNYPATDRTYGNDSNYDMQGSNSTPNVGRTGSTGSGSAHNHTASIGNGGKHTHVNNFNLKHLCTLLGERVGA